MSVRMALGPAIQTRLKNSPVLLGKHKQRNRVQVTILDFQHNAFGLILLCRASQFLLPAVGMFRDVDLFSFGNEQWNDLLIQLWQV